MFASDLPSDRLAARSGEEHGRSLGDVVGLARLYEATVERIRQADMLEAAKRVRVAELTQ